MAPEFFSDEILIKNKFLLLPC